MLTGRVWQFGQPCIVHADGHAVGACQRHTQVDLPCLTCDVGRTDDGNLAVDRVGRTVDRHRKREGFRCHIRIIGNGNGHAVHTGILNLRHTLAVLRQRDGQVIRNREHGSVGAGQSQPGQRVN